GTARNFDGGDCAPARSGAESAPAAGVIRTVSPRVSAGHSGRRRAAARGAGRGAKTFGKSPAHAARAHRPATFRTLIQPPEPPRFSAKNDRVGHSAARRFAIGGEWV